MNVIGYARVSSRSQSYEIQVSQIKDYCKFKDFELMQVFADKESGKDIDRTEFKQMMDTITKRPYEINAVVVTKLDRVGRSIRDLLNFVDWCKSQDVQFVAFQSSIDTTNKEGRLFFYIMGALAEYERELIIERTEYGRKKYIEEHNGKWGRRKKTLNLKEIRRQMAEGVPVSVIARNFKVSRATVYKRIDEDNYPDKEVE